MEFRCEICGVKTKDVVELNDGFKAHLCKDCDLLVTEAKHEESALEEVNKQFYRLEDRVLTYYPREMELTKRHQKILRYICSFHSGSIEDVLEIGSNIGFFASFVKQNGINIETVEINNELREFQRLVYGIKSVSNINEISSDKKFDVIILLDVLEHVPNPINFLSTIKKHLKKNGIIFLQFPNKNSLSARLSGSKWPWWLAPDHLYHFSQKSISLIAEKAGLEMVNIRTVSTILDDLINLPYIGKFFHPFLRVNRAFVINPLVKLKMGSLLQVVLANGEEN